MSEINYAMCVVLALAVGSQ